MQRCRGDSTHSAGIDNSCCWHFCRQRILKNTRLLKSLDKMWNMSFCGVDCRVFVLLWCQTQRNGKKNKELRVHNVYNNSAFALNHMLKFTSVFHTTGDSSFWSLVAVVLLNGNLFLEKCAFRSEFKVSASIRSKEWSYQSHRVALVFRNPQ